MKNQVELKDNIVVGISQTKNLLIGSRYVEVEKYDESLLGKIWDGENFIDPPYVPEYLPLSKLELIRLLVSEGGATQTQVIQAKQDANLEYFWLMFDIAGDFDREDQELIDGINALEALGYISSAQTVLDKWPTIQKGV